jgi:hypothetical protein
LAYDISSNLENQLVFKLGYQKFLQSSPRVVKVVTAVVIIVDEEKGRSWRQSSMFEHGQNRHGAQLELARRLEVGPEVSNVLDA